VETGLALNPSRDEGYRRAGRRAAFVAISVTLFVVALAVLVAAVLR
jgi:hypothetical protein